ncbi:uncharacterized protein BO95DRAFT_42472 [Aspergillus brunneoviolaceus CBS 621.78]|uniref:Uncharacterized protein n=1 Tax=Aspergillus brunneoviolaceus CBS 621.78 TaxID=1450534 RepID=A0ACD1GGY0_9EURO|nr:hypothetical protein BO95DRAFT_42472 [Aspergillus brunneoviolaceus CBS 621.78]RAH48585.1 hypothetical protein BO95DRAFT_42472 [Aspergillus brunneoviolaceus CBS 621.78]
MHILYLSTLPIFLLCLILCSIFIVSGRLSEPFVAFAIRLYVFHEAGLMGGILLFFFFFFLIVYQDEVEIPE